MARLVLILAVAATYLPFVGQAFHVDDRIYLEVASNIFKKPLFPYDYPPIFEGLVSPDAASHSHLPLVSYYLALIKGVTGSEAEWVYHLAFLIFPLLATFGFYELAQRYVRFPLAAACLLIVAPAFLVLSHTLMADLPLLAFWIISLSRFLKIMDGQGRRRDWVACSLSLLAASFISLLSSGLVLLMAAYFVLKRLSDREAPSSLPSTANIVSLLALPLVLWLLWYTRAYIYYDRFLLLNTFLHMSKRAAFSWELIGQKAVSFTLNLGGVFLFPLVLWYAFAGKISARIFLLLFLLSFVPFYVWFGNWSWMQIFLFALFFSSGMLCFHAFGVSFLRVFVFPLFRVLASKTRTHEDTKTGLLLLWFFGIFVSYLFFYYAGSVRYCVLVLPPLILLWLKSLERSVKDTYFLRNLIGLAVVLTAGYALVISYADHQFAEVYRKRAREICRDYRQPGRSVWFTGEWGFRHYMEQAGARIITRTGIGPKPGDILVKPYLASPWVTLYDDRQYVDLVEQRDAEVDSPIRILDFSSHAGFYSAGWGILPISITGGEKWEWFNVLEVKREYEGAIPEQERHW